MLLARIAIAGSRRHLNAPNGAMELCQIRVRKDRLSGAARDSLFFATPSEIGEMTGGSRQKLGYQ
jgi:hypothetical protein